MFERGITALGKKLNLDANYFLKGAFWLSLGNVLLALFSILSTWVLTTYLSKNDFGFFQFFISILGILSIFTIVETKTSLVLSISKGYDGTLQFLKRKKLLFSVLGSVALLVIAGFFYLTKDNYWQYFFITAFLFPLLYGLQLQVPFFNGKSRFEEVFKLNVARKIVIWIPVMVVAFWYQQILLVVLVFILFSAFFEVFSYLYAKQFVSNDKIDTDSFPYAMKLSAIQVIPIIARHIDKIILSFFLGLAELANYAVILLFGSQINTFFSFIKPLVLPKMSKQHPKKILKAIWNKIPFILIFNILVVIAGILIIPFIISYFFKQYTTIIFLVQLLLISESFSYISTLLSSFITAQKEVKYISLMFLVIPSLKIVLFLIMIPLLGTLGAVLSLMIANVLRFLYLMIVSFHLIGFK